MSIQEPQKQEPQGKLSPISDIERENALKILKSLGERYPPKGVQQVLSPEEQEKSRERFRKMAADADAQKNPLLRSISIPKDDIVEAYKTIQKEMDLMDSAIKSFGKFEDLFSSPDRDPRVRAKYYELAKAKQALGLKYHDPRDPMFKYLKMIDQAELDMNTIFLEQSKRYKSPEHEVVTNYRLK